jgi:NADH-quinone oxidoreductase subunit L
MNPTGYFLDHLWLIPLFPLATAALMFFFGKRLPKIGVSVLCVGSVGLSFIYAVGAVSQLLAADPERRVAQQILFEWLTPGAMQMTGGHLVRFVADWGFLLDPLSAVMVLVVTGVGFLIHVYSVGYMAHEGGYYRFFGYMNLFMFAMLTLVLANNLLLMFVGWEGVGLCSYLLIGFYFLKKSASDAGKKAFIVNRIGDAGFLLGLLLTAVTLGTIRFTAAGLPDAAGYSGVLQSLESAVHAGTLAYGAPVLTAIALLLFVGAAGKSAQIPLYVWLPDAMEGPTPVSALIHAATMVTAGVYLVARASAIFTASPTAQIVIAVIAGASALYAAIVACAQTDIKRVLAYSTMSQLAYMFMGEAVEGYSNGIFHLTTHAYFKALLFMCAGAVIHALGGEQDMRKMGGLRGRLPRTFVMFVVGALALAAIFPFSGFWSKDAILGDVLQKAINTGSPGWYVLYGAGLLTAALSGFYIFRLLWLVFGGAYRGDAIAVHGHGEAASDAPSAAGDPLTQVHEPGPSLLVPMVILAVLSVIGGFYGTPWNDWIGEFLSPTVHSVPDIPAGDPRALISDLVGLGVALLGIGYAWLRYGRGQTSVSVRESPAAVFVRSGLGIDALYGAVIVRPLLALARGLRTVVEDGVLDGGTRGVGGLFAAGSRALRTLQTGYARNYAVWIFLGAALIVLYFMIFPQLR